MKEKTESKRNEQNRKRKKGDWEIMQKKENIDKKKWEREVS